MNKDEKKETEKFIRDYLDVSDDTEPNELMEAKLNNLNFARVFLCLYYLKLQGIQYSRKLFAKRAKISQSNISYYLNYFMGQGFVKIIPLTKGSKRNSMIRACNNESNKDIWDNMIKIAIKTITDKDKLQDEVKL